MDIAFNEIEQEFNETFGYVRQDIAKILEKQLGLDYTIALLVCCACEMLTWHRDLRHDQAHEIFASLLPEPYRAVGKTLWEALRNGLAHNFRPDTIRIGEDDWRFSISSEHEHPHVKATKGRPHWIQLNIRTCSSLVITQIDAYERQLRTNPDARLKFREEIEKVQPDGFGRGGQDCRRTSVNSGRRISRPLALRPSYATWKVDPWVNIKREQAPHARHQ